MSQPRRWLKLTRLINMEYDIFEAVDWFTGKSRSFVIQMGSQKFSVYVRVQGGGITWENGRVILRLERLETC